MPTVNGQSFPYSTTGKNAAAKKRQRLLKERYGKNWRQNFYGPVSGYQKGAVSKINKLRERINATGGTDKQNRQYDRLYDVAEAVRERRQRFDAKQTEQAKQGFTGRPTLSGGRSQTVMNVSVRPRKKRRLPSRT